MPTRHPPESAINVERVDGRYSLKEVLGVGSHAVVYRGRDIISGRDVAVKLERSSSTRWQDSSESLLKHEYYILKELQGGVGVPRPLFFGRESSYYALVLNDVSKPLCDMLASQGGRLKLDVVVDVGYQLVQRLEYIHSHNYIHRDIKPHNVLLGNATTTSNPTVFLSDFGIAFQYRNPATRVHALCQHECRFVGTPAFASVNHHLGIQSSRRDDLESLAYTLIYLMQGSLSWLSSTHPDLSNHAILKLKQDTTVDELCNGLPSEFATFLQYSRSLAYTAKPDYAYLRSLLHHHTHNALATNCGSAPDIGGLTDDNKICENTSNSVVHRATTPIPLAVGPTDHQQTCRGV